MPVLKFPSRRTFAQAVVAAGLVVCAFAFSVASASAATWSIQTTPNASGAEHSALYDISCEGAGTNACVSVGKQTASGGTSGPYGQYWNGSSWANQAATTPEGATAGEFQSVDCLSALVFEKIFCYAAGSYTSGGVTRPLVEVTFGSLKWAVSTSATPEGASESAFRGIACRPGSTACFAVGYAVEGGVKTVLVEKLSETKWVIDTMPVPEGAVSSELHGIDCASTTFCMAVGSYTLVGGGPQWAMSATWDGKTWTSRAVAKPTESKASVLLDVSCASSSNCTGVGGYKNSKNTQVSFVERWNGTTWSHQSSPNPGGSTNTVFQGVSCVTGTPCVAVGDWFNGKNWQPMAQEWTGAAWALDTTPTPTGATFSLLEGVACRTACLGSGWYTDSEGKNKTLGETR